MPGPFTHIYAARRIADFLAHQKNFVSPNDGPVIGTMNSPEAAAGFARVMNQWPKFANLGAIGPDLFFFCMDFHADAIPCDEIMLALRAVYTVDDAKRDDWEPFLAIIDKINHPWAAILRFIIKLQKIWAKFMQVWNDTIGVVTNALGQFIDDLSGGMLSALGDALTALADDIVALFIEELVTSADVFGFFSLVMQEGVDEQSFLWSDMTHYRKTSQFAMNLDRQAQALTGQQREQFLAYTLGYICHMGTDIVAHSFVNEQCGGPFRTHWQRHHLIENHIDAWNYKETQSGGSLPADPSVAATGAFPALDRSALYFTVQIPKEPVAAGHSQNGDDRPATLPPEGKTPAEKRARKEALDTDGEMPLWMAKEIVKALIATYYNKDDPHSYPANLKGSDFQTNVVDQVTVDGVKVWNDEPLGFDVPAGFPLPWEIQVTYRFMLTFFKRTFMDSFDLPKPPRPTIAPFPTINPNDFVPDFSGVNPSDPPAKQLLDILLALLFWLFKSLKSAADFAYNAGKSALSAATLIPREAIYYGITLPAWQAVRNIREVLVHLGFILPQDRELGADGEELHPSEIDEQLVRLGHTVDGAFRQALADAGDPLGNLDKDPNLIPDTVREAKSADYPFLPIRDDQGNAAEYHRPWAYPDKRNDESPNLVEQFRTMSGPFPTESTPDALLRPDTGGDNQARYDYEHAPTPHETDCLNERLVGHDSAKPLSKGLAGPLGDATAFSAYLIGRITGDPKSVADFNLDADRGYGYLCWDWNRKQKAPHSSYRGRHFEEPCAWPEAAHPNNDDTAAQNAHRKWASDQSILKLHYKNEPDPGCDTKDESPDDC